MVLHYKLPRFIGFQPVPRGHRGGEEPGGKGFYHRGTENTENGKINLSQSLCSPCPCAQWHRTKGREHTEAQRTPRVGKNLNQTLRSLCLCGEINFSVPFVRVGNRQGSQLKSEPVVGQKNVIGQFLLGGSMTKIMAQMRKERSRRT
jgi:hypothetical protein